MDNRKLISEWGEFLYTQGLSKNTITAYQNALEKLLDWHDAEHGHNLDPAKIKSAQLQQWQEHQMERGLNPSTIKQRLSSIRQFFTWIQLIGKRQDNPAQQIRSLSEDDISLDPIAADDVSRLLREADKRARERQEPFAFRDRAMILLMLRAGLRVSELLQLRIGDIKFKHHSGSVVVKGSPGREIALEVKTREAIGVYMDFEHPAPEEPSEPLWYGLQGPISSRSTVNRMLANFEVEGLTPQRLRDTFAADYLDDHPGDFQGLSEVLGGLGS